jgi:hypothetical protein
MCYTLNHVHGYLEGKDACIKSMTYVLCMHSSRIHTSWKRCMHGWKGYNNLMKIRCACMERML